MSAGKALAIVKQIDSDSYTDEEKAMAIYIAMKMPTLMSVTKAELITAIKWLWDRAYEFVDEKEGAEE